MFVIYVSLILNNSMVKNWSVSCLYWGVLGACHSSWLSPQIMPDTKYILFLKLVFHDRKSSQPAFQMNNLETLQRVHKELL